MMKIYMKGLILMLSLVQIQNDQALVSSRQVAEHFEKNHRDLLRDIRLLISTIQVIQSTTISKDLDSNRRWIKLHRDKSEMENGCH